MTSTAFGPQGPNYTTTRPPADPKASAGVDTFFKNCSSAGAKDGTFATADFFNVTLANLRYLVRTSGVTLDDATDTMVYDSIAQMIENGVSNYALDTGSPNALVVALPATITAYTPGMLIYVKVANTCTGPSTIRVNGMGVVPILHSDQSPMGQNDLLLAEIAELVFDGVNFQKVGTVARAQSIVQTLTANLTYYVNGSTGNDLNTGLTTGAPFATIQKAINSVAVLNANGYAVTINIADGTYAGFFIGSAINGNLNIVGNTTNWANVLINGVSGGGSITARGNGVTLTLQGVELTNGVGYGLISQAGASVNISQIVFGACSTAQIFCDSGTVSVIGDYHITGNAVSHVAVNYGSFIGTPSGFNTVTLSGGPVFTVTYQVSGIGFVRMNARTTFNGAAGAGQRYQVTGNGVIDTSGAGASFLPGTTAGAIATGGEYL
jgi:hypothetical protein